MKEFKLCQINNEEIHEKIMSGLYYCDNHSATGF